MVSFILHATTAYEIRKRREINRVVHVLVLPENKSIIMLFLVYTINYNGVIYI